MREIGVNAYRLSISWPRVIPAGAGAVNNKGLGFYDSVIDELLAKEIEPWITLFIGITPMSSSYAAAGSTQIVRNGSPTTSKWSWIAYPTGSIVGSHSMNPSAFFTSGIRSVITRQGLKLGLHEVLLATHHTLFAHGLGVQAIRARAKKKPHVGWAPVGWFCYPVSDKPEDIEASRQATMQVKDGWNTCWYADPVILGRYPEDGLKTFGDAVPKFPASDLERMCQPLDFYGFNSYTGGPTKRAPRAARSIRNCSAGHGHRCSSGR